MRLVRIYRTPEISSIFFDRPDLDSISVGDGGASPLAPVFGSSRELDVLPSFLAEPERRAEAADKGLLPEVAQLASHGLGLQLSAAADADMVTQVLGDLATLCDRRGDPESAARYRAELP